MQHRGTNREGTEELKGTSGGGDKELSVLGRGGRRGMLVGQSATKDS